MLLQPPCHYFLQNPPSAASPQLPGWGMDRQWRMVLRGFLNLWFGYQDSRGYIALIKLPLRNLKQNITGVCTGGGEKYSGRVGGWVGCTWPSPEDQSPERQVVESKQRSDMKNQRKWEKWRGEGGEGKPVHLELSWCWTLQKSGCVTFPEFLGIQISLSLQKKNGLWTWDSWADLVPFNRKIPYS